MTKWIENLDIILNTKGFGLNRDFEKEMVEHIKNWINHLNSNSSDLVASFENTYEGIIVTVKKRKGDNRGSIEQSKDWRISPDSYIVRSSFTFLVGSWSFSASCQV